MRTIIRRAEEREADFIAESNAAMALETEDLKLDIDRLKTGVKAVMEDENKGFYLIVEIEETPVACLLITKEWSDWRNAWWWWIQSVYVVREHRKKKIFSLMYNEVERLAQANNTAGLRLYVDEDNHIARKVYSKCGMKESNYIFYEAAFN